MEVLYINTVKDFKTRREMIKYLMSGKSASYSDAACRNKQCDPGKNRSIDDLLAIVRSKFPKTSLNALVKHLTFLMGENRSTNFAWCTTIRNVVILDTPYFKNDYITSYSRRNYYHSVSNSGMSLEKIENIINQ